MPFLLSLAFLSSYSGFFGVLSNFLSSFISCFLWSLCLLVSRVFLIKPLLHKLELKQSPLVDKAFALAVLLLCKLIRNYKILRITVQPQPHQYDCPLKTRVANYLPTQLHI